MSERFLKWAIKRHYKGLGYKVRMARIRLGNTEIDGEAVSPDDERIAIEIKTPCDDFVRGIGQMTAALAYGYNRAILATTSRNAKKIMANMVFKKFSFGLIGVDSRGNVTVLAV